MPQATQNALPTEDELAAHLATYGFVVIPVLRDPNARKMWEARMWSALDDMPEYRVKGKPAQRVLGGFGALGNPASFHHPTVQELRKNLKAFVSKPLFAALARQTMTPTPADVKLEMLFDRVCVRFKHFGSVSSESWHRDIYDGPKFGHRSLPETLNDGRAPDEIFGGWLNLSDQNTHFKGIAKSHLGQEARAAQRGGGGFSQLTPQQVSSQNVEARLAAQAGQTFGRASASSAPGRACGSIIVPPGHQIIFYQRLLHAVAGGPGPTEPQLRLFVGHRLTRESAPLFPLERVISTNAVPCIPSGQTPPMFSQNHYAFFQKENRYQRWGAATFKAPCLFARRTTSGEVYYTPGSRDDVDPEANRKRSMPSLASMGFPVYAYTASTLRTLTPESLFAAAA